MPGLGAVPAPRQLLPTPVCCAVYGAIIHSEDNAGPASPHTGWPFRFTTHWHQVKNSNGDQEPGALCMVLFATREKIREGWELETRGFI